MRTSSTLLQALSLLVFIGGVIAGIITLNDYRSGALGIPIIASGVISAIFFYALSDIIDLLDRIEVNSRRSANAAEQARRDALPPQSQETLSQEQAEQPEQPSAPARRIQRLSDRLK